MPVSATMIGLLSAWHLLIAACSPVVVSGLLTAGLGSLPSRPTTSTPAQSQVKPQRKIGNGQRHDCDNQGGSTGDHGIGAQADDDSNCAAHSKKDVTVQVIPLSTHGRNIPQNATVGNKTRVHGRRRTLTWPHATLLDLVLSGPVLSCLNGIAVDSRVVVANWVHLRCADVTRGICYGEPMTTEAFAKPTLFRRTFELVMDFEEAMREGRTRDAAAIEKRACANSTRRRVWFEMSRQLLAEDLGDDVADAWS